MQNQTTDVKTLPIARVTQFHNSHTAMFQTVSQTRGSCSNTDHSILIRKAKIFYQINWFSPGTSHSSLSTLTLTVLTHNMTTVHTTKSNDSAASVTKTSVCVCLKNINKKPSQQVGVFAFRMFAMNISF